MASLASDSGEPDRFWLTRLTNFYKKYNPEKISSLPGVLVKYKGNEHKLFSAMIKKYGPEPSVMDNFNEGEISDDEDGDDDDGVNNSNGSDVEDGDEEEDDDDQKMPALVVSSVEGTPDDWPCTVPLCPVNRLPAEYCEYSKKFDKSKPWLLENYPNLYLQNFDKTVAAECGGEEEKPEGTDGVESLKKGVEEVAIDPNDPRAAKKAAKRERKAEAERKKALKKKVVDKAPRVVVNMKRRNKRKFTVNIYGLDKFGVKLKEAAKKFSKKFACSSTVTKNDMGEKEISMQGDFSQDLGNIIVTMFPAITIDRIYFNTKKGTIAASSIKVGQRIV